MSLDPPTYLASLQSNIRQRPIPWDGAVRAGTITDDQLAKIRTVDKAKKTEARQQAVEADLDGYRLLFVGEPGKPSVLESASKHANMVQYVLVLLGDLLSGMLVGSRYGIYSRRPSWSGYMPLIAPLQSPIGAIYIDLFYQHPTNVIGPIPRSSTSFQSPF
jgi:V-type H+-transporting ATPase subunit H